MDKAASLGLLGLALFGCRDKAGMPIDRPDGSQAPDGGRDSGGSADTQAEAAPGGDLGAYLHPSAPPGAPGAFGGGPSSEAAARPALVYPLADAMLGRNIAGMNVQWRAGAGNTLYRVRVSGKLAWAQLYAGDGACRAGKCQLPVPDGFWLALAHGNAGTTAAIVVDAVEKAGAPVASSTMVTISFSPTDLAGGLYYWSSGLEGTYRVKLGESTPEPFLGATTPGNSRGCIGCHTLSRDGCRLAFKYYAGTLLGIADARDPTRLYTDPPTEKSDFQAWSPDGKHLITALDGQLTLRDNRGAPISAVPRGFVGPAGADYASHPEWSTDGRTIALTRLAETSMADHDLCASGDIALMPYNDGAFGPATVLVAHSKTDYHYYPHFSPDSKWIVFNTATPPWWKHPDIGGCEGTDVPAYSQRTARLQLVRASGGPPMELARATHGTSVTASWPKFSPFSQSGGNLMFIVFSSAIDYGFVVEQDPIWAALGKGRPQLWVAAIDVTRPSDPSYAPFWLPFQLATEGNHLGYWTTKIVSATAGGECE